MRVGASDYVGLILGSFPSKNYLCRSFHSFAITPDVDLFLERWLLLIKSFHLQSSIAFHRDGQYDCGLRRSAEKDIIFYIMDHEVPTSSLGCHIYDAKSVHRSDRNSRKRILHIQWYCTEGPYTGSS